MKEIEARSEARDLQELFLPAPMLLHHINGMQSYPSVTVFPLFPSKGGREGGYWVASSVCDFFQFGALQIVARDRVLIPLQSIATVL